MRISKLGLVPTVVAVVLCTSAPSAYANPLPNMVLTSAGSNAMGGYLVNPYTARFNGGPAMPVICDDFGTNSYVGETWHADAYRFSDLTKLKFYNAADPTGSLNKYNAAAWLGVQLLDSSSTNAQKGWLSYAIWEIFTPGAFSHISGADRTNATNYKNAALDATKGFDATHYSDWVVYTPDPLSASQEFMARAPESPAVALLGLNFAGLLGLVGLFRRRLVRG
jgi:hypothetical protein